MSDVLTHSPADVLAQMMVDLGLGTDPPDEDAWPVYATKEPNLPDQVMTVFDALGTSYGYSSNDGYHYHKEGVQVRARATTPKDGYTKLAFIVGYLNKNALAKQVTVTLDGTSYCVEVVTLGMVIPLRRTDVPTSSRSVHVTNGFVTLRQL